MIRGLEDSLKVNRRALQKEWCVKRLWILVLAIVLSLGVLIAAGQDASAARFLGYNAANDSNKIVTHINAMNTDEEYRVREGIRDWNGVRANYVPNTNFPGFIYDTSTPDPVSLYVRVYAADDGLRGYYRHNPGPTADTVNINRRNLSDETSAEKQRTTSHELGHAGSLGHPDVGTSYCNNTVMLPSVPCEGIAIITNPGSYDYESVRAAPRYFSNDRDSVIEAKSEYATIKGKKTLVAKTVPKPNGGFEILEYDVK